MTYMYQPLFGDAGKQKSDPNILKQMQELGAKQDISSQTPQSVKNTLTPKPQSPPFSQASAITLDGLMGLAKNSNQFGDFIENNKKIIALIIVLLILVLLAYVIYNQQKQRKVLKEVTKRMQRMMRHNR